jgi:hypothetical protein
MQQMPCIAVFLSIQYSWQMSSLAGIPENLIVFAWGILQPAELRYCMCVEDCPARHAYRPVITVFLRSSQWTSGPALEVVSMSADLPMPVAGDAW